MIELRQAIPEDKKFFLEIYNQEDSLDQMESKILIKEEWYPLLISNPNSLWFVIEEDKISLGLLNSYVKGDKIYFGIIVSKDKRRQGIARKALNKYLEFMDSQKMDSYLDCFSNNPAKKLYKELGYKQTGIYKKVRKRKFIQMKRTFVYKKTNT